VSLPNEAPPEESDPADSHVRNKFPSPNRKRRSTRLAESGQMAASAKQRGNATGSCGLDEEDSNPSPMTSSALIGSYPDEEVVVQDEATTPDVIPSGWVRVKLEPDC
jgi:hypothetical protein